MKDIRECDYAGELLSAYCDGELEVSQRASVEDHLKGCAACRKALASVESVVQSLKALPPVRLSRDLSSDIEALIKKSDAPAHPTHRRSPRTMWLAAAAAVVALLIAGGYFVTTGGGRGTVVATNSPGEIPAEVKMQRPAVSKKLEDERATSRPVVAETPAVVETVPATTKQSGASDRKELVAELPKSMKILSKTQKPPEDRKVEGGSKTGAAKPSAPVDLDDLSEDEALLAFSDSSDGDFFDSEISTDEDGLYAIKM